MPCWALFSGEDGAWRGACGCGACLGLGAAGEGAGAAIAGAPGGDADSALGAAGQNPGAAGVAQAQVEGEAGFLVVLGRGLAGGGGGPGEGFELAKEAEKEGEEEVGHTSGVRFQGGAQAGDEGREGGREVCMRGI